MDVLRTAPHSPGSVIEQTEYKSFASLNDNGLRLKSSADTLSGKESSRKRIISINFCATKKNQ